MDENQIGILDKNQIGILVTTATTYAANAASIFNLFLTVCFGSLAFAAALPLKSIGDPHPFFEFCFSSSSLMFAVAFLAFYIIDFISFQSAGNKLNIVLRELKQQISCWTFKNPDTLNVFQPARPVIRNLRLSSIGFLIGSIASLIGFLWISNVDRSVGVKLTKEFEAAMAAGVTDRLWELKDIVALIDANETPPKKHGDCEKRISN